MSVRFTVRHFEISATTKEFLENKLSKLRKFDEHISEMDIVLTLEKYRYIVEIKLKGGPFEAGAKEENADLITAFDACLKQVERQIKKQKEKLIDSKKHAKKKLAEFRNTVDVRESSEPQIIKREIVIPTITELEAIVRFKKDKLDFLQFKNSKTKRISLLIKDSNQNLILQEIK